MASVATFDDLIARLGAQSYLKQIIWGEIQSATTGGFAGTNTGTYQRIGDTLDLPSLPGGVSAFIPLKVGFLSSTAIVGVLIAKATNFGSFDIGAANTGVYTDSGVAMPTGTILGNAATSYTSSLFVEVTTALAGTQTAVTITYTNQAGSSGQTTPTFTPTTGAVARSMSQIVLAGTDWGVQDVSAVSRSSSAGPTGVLKFWGIMPIAYLPIPTINHKLWDNLLTSGFNFMRLGAGDHLITIVTGSTATKAITGDIIFLGDT